MLQLDLKRVSRFLEQKYKRVLSICLLCRRVRNGSSPSRVPAASLAELKDTRRASAKGEEGRRGEEEKRRAFCFIPPAL